MAIPTRFVQIDEEGYGLSGDIRIQDPQVGAELLQNLQVHQGGTLLSTFGETPVIVEAFDEPLVAANVEFNQDGWHLILPYGVRTPFKLESLTVDEWDRFHGYTLRNVPFVFSRSAQAEFFNLVDEYGDDYVEFRGQNYAIPPYWSDTPQVENESFWSNIYQTTENPGWNLGEPAEALKDMLQRLKIPKSRILVLGCGEGHDAAHFAQNGHIVTAVDISPDAIARGKKLYGHLPNLEFVEADIFKLPREFDQSFDVIFEHTCYCAINPQKRGELVKIWNRLLAPEGHLMGVFFAFEKRTGPPFGGSEWELRKRLKGYQPIFWGRWQKSVPARQGKEFFVYSKKKN